MVNFVPGFISADVWRWSAEQSAEEARLKAVHRDSKAKSRRASRPGPWPHPVPVTNAATVADHIEHVVKVAGHDHVGIGGDMDGIPFAPTGLDGVEDYPNLFAELIRRGWSDDNLARLAGGNVLRALRRAEEVSASMKNEPAALSDLDTK